VVVNLNKHPRTLILNPGSAPPVTSAAEILEELSLYLIDPLSSLSPSPVSLSLSL
jgi:hypothetical protein